MFIERISQMLAMRAIQDQYCDSFGHQPYNVSSWLSSNKYSTAMKNAIEMAHIDSFEYMYTYSLDKKILANVLEKFAQGASESYGITFVDNGTQAIVTLINWIKQHGFKKIAILNPAYFSIAQGLRAFEISYDEVNLIRTPQGYTLPFEQLSVEKYDVIWFTSPVFSTSVYHNEKTMDQLEHLMAQGTFIISDECFCVSGNEVLRRIQNRERFIGIYSPHKALCLNTCKFAALVYPKPYDLFIEHWVDVLNGNLPASSINAIYHFLSPNFDRCLMAYKNFMNNAREHVKGLILKMPKVSIDEVETGSLMTIYLNHLSFEQSLCHEFFESVLSQTGQAFYPSHLNGLDHSFGFAFRINLALYEDAFMASLEKLLHHLSNCEAA